MNEKPIQHVLGGHRDLTSVAKFHQSEQLIASVCRSGQFCVWELTEKVMSIAKPTKKRRQVIQHPMAVHVHSAISPGLSLSWDPEDRWVAVSYQNGDCNVFFW